MSSLEERIRADLTTAMRERDKGRTSALRMLIAAIGEEKVAGDAAKELTDDDVEKIIQRLAKQRSEAADSYAEAGRDEQAAAELAEREVLAVYLPEPLGEEELAALVAEVLAAEGFDAPSQMGQAMKAVQPKIAGRAEGKAVAAAVKAHLAG
ncbi:MAG: GatB/YqeY domain-containing protein [Actinomycetota bacterium]